MDDNEDKKPITERIEDTPEKALYKVQNAVYGEKNAIYLIRWKIRVASAK
ncbi:MAG: hypothetical protein IJ317_05815 [Clostridia bacterium]|nr:hypothetical protein [Clostridia bacterium]